MNNIIWKNFILGDLFKLSICHELSKSAKEYKGEEIQLENTIANISATKYNNGVMNYIPIDNEINRRKKCNYLTLVNTVDGAGYCFYHDYDFVSTGGNKVLLYKNNKLQDIFINHKLCGIFFAKIITKIFRIGIFNWGYTITNRTFEREQILIPCIECNKEESIWEDNNKYYTLAINYIEQLITKVNKIKEKKIIEKYKYEKNKYEVEKKIYENNYLLEKSNIVWKKIILGKLFSLSTCHKLSKPSKEYEGEKVQLENTIANVTATIYNNGVMNYIPIDNEINNKKRKYYLTIANMGDYAGYCFYHDYDFISTTISNRILLYKNSKLQDIFIKNKLCGVFFAKIITKIFLNNIFSWGYTISDDRFQREPIVLPFIECTKEESIYEEKDKYYTLPINYISYIYSSGKIQYYQKLIDKY